MFFTYRAWKYGVSNGRQIRPVWFDVTVYNRTRAKAGKYGRRMGGTGTTPAEGQRRATGFRLRSNDADLNAVITGDEGAAAGMDKDAI